MSNILLIKGLTDEEIEYILLGAHYTPLRVEEEKDGD